MNTAIENNITKFGLICSRIDDFPKLMNIYNNYSDSFNFTIGIHPHHANELNENNLSKFKDLVVNNSPHAVGETGLDFFRNLSTYEEQIYAFEEQIKIAINLNKPLFLHQRDSHEDFIKILRKYSSEINKSVVHCFTGTNSQLDDYLERGLYIGLTGWICDERRNKDLREAIKDIPADKLMIETDAPYLIPRNLKMKPKNNRNEPKFLPHIADEVASLMNINLEEFNKQVFDNGISFFNINLKD